MSVSMSPVEYENLEQKYLESKAKLKKTVQYNERYSLQVQKLNKRLKRLESENKQLASQAKARDTSESEGSSSVNLHQERSSMIELVHSKNQQISDLLKDIEEMETENTVLRDKLVEAKDQLAAATKEITATTEKLKTLENLLEERDESLKHFSSQLDQLKDQLKATNSEKAAAEKQLTSAHNHAKQQESEWKALLQGKDDEILLLKRSLPEALSSKSPAPSKEDQLSENKPDFQEEKKLELTLAATEEQLSELKLEMQNCVAEMRQSAKVINKLKEERQAWENQLKSMKEAEKSMATQLKKAHDRCQAMQKEVEYANKLTNMYVTDLNSIKEQMTENGQCELVTQLEDIEALKVEKMLHEKQIVGLVRDINKIQEMLNILQIENTDLRDRLGITSDVDIEIDPELINESKKEKKMIAKLQAQLRHHQEENIGLKLEAKSLKQQIATFLNEPKSEAGANDIKALSEENEALRKGLHEILNSVRVKNETEPRELKSDVLERLLKALDVKHTSGWYHPDMRIQAELHTLEGVNMELREQLHDARNELDKLKRSLPTNRSQDTSIENPKQNSGRNEIRAADSKIMDAIFATDVPCIEKVKTSILKILLYFMETGEEVDSQLESEFEMVKDNLNLLHVNCQREQEAVVKKLKILEQELDTPLIDIDLVSSMDLSAMIQTERKKSHHLFNQLIRLQDEHSRARSDLANLSKNHQLELDALLRLAVFLQAKLCHEKVHHCTATENSKELQSSLNDYVKKYRQLLGEVEGQRDQHNLEKSILKHTEADLTKENRDLKDKLNKLLVKLNQEVHKEDPSARSLSKKVADLEVEALSEKNRANHTNNLYELVKEQLRKSEEKFSEFSKFGDGLVQKNLLLQERIVELEDQLLCVDTADIHKNLEENIESLMRDNKQLIADKAALSARLQEREERMQQATSWSMKKEQELLVQGLKHEILDLTATSDEKTVIDALYSDLSKSRSDTRDYQLQVDFLRREVSTWEAGYAKLCSEMERQRSQFATVGKSLDKKIRTLQDIVLKQRIQYHGCVALTNQEILVEKLNTIQKERHEAFLALQSARETRDKIPPEASSRTQDPNHQSEKRQVDYLQQKVKKQDLDLQRLEKELFLAYQLGTFEASNKNSPRPPKRRPVLVWEIASQETVDPVATAPEKPESKMVIMRNMDCQTEKQKPDETPQLEAARIHLNNLQSQLSVKDSAIIENKRSDYVDAIKLRLLLVQEGELSECREQLRRSKEEVAFLENQTVCLGLNLERAKMPSSNQHNGGAGDGSAVPGNSSEEDFLSLRVTLKNAQDRIRHKDSEIIKYQTLLKTDRDRHSLAAANLQQELVVLRKALLAEQQNTQSFQQDLAAARNKSAAVEKYISQVRALEKHLAELHTKQAQLQAQLQNSLQEAARWREMAQDRLLAMQQLGKSLNDQHNKELHNYKTDYQKLKELSEEEPGKKATPEQKLAGFLDPDVLKLCRDKDEKIQELSSKLKQLEAAGPVPNGQPAIQEKPSRLKEFEILKTKCEVLANKERHLKEELRDLREQLSKKANLSARSQKSEKSVKEQLQKRVSFLEREIEELNEKLTSQQLINEKHKFAANEDFEKWKKQKFWQENCEKYKTKLQEREEEFQKLQQTCTGYRMLIERLEREKISLENRVKALRSEQKNMLCSEDKSVLKIENDRLTCELAALQAKLEMRQHGDGALSTAVMQEKLEAQERKIAILELSTKGTVELRNELERLQTSLAHQQKSNLCLEAENLELKMDLEKHTKETPHLQEQIQHLENYIELLKDENQQQASSSSDAPCVAESREEKKVSQLERTVFILKRVVEKLQVENKRLLSGKRPLSERSPSADKLRRDHIRLKEQHTDSLQKIQILEAHLQAAKKLSKSRMESAEVEQLKAQLDEVKEQLAQKAHLLEKVKSLLHAAAAKEKRLLEEIAELKFAIDRPDDHQLDIPSPIEEVSEISSDN
ncbi:centrosomal protein of 290 kDa [Dendroctonus ponderosae]|uniref:centrosomal protein of 290 kDa n=1 Tax=Dendroctonus ponderosae TaxID=77166 RepID=UPI0020363995|nr:centrosomal protein of 290 kDa [Dendroctonus ponderosae]